MGSNGSQSCAHHKPLAPDGHQRCAHHEPMARWLSNKHLCHRHPLASEERPSPHGSPVPVGLGIMPGGINAAAAAPRAENNHPIVRLVRPLLASRNCPTEEEPANYRRQIPRPQLRTNVEMNCPTKEEPMEEPPRPQLRTKVEMKAKVNAKVATVITSAAAAPTTGSLSAVMMMMMTAMVTS